MLIVLTTVLYREFLERHTIQRQKHVFLGDTSCGVMCVKGLIAATFESSKLLQLLKAKGMSVPSLHRVYRLSDN